MTSIRSRYSERNPVLVICDPEKSKTKGSFKDETDINKIVAKYRQTGVLPQRAAVGRFVDVSDVPDYQSALDLVREAQNAFASLPAAVRLECNNDPATFVQKVSDRAWAEKHKLIDPKPPSPAPADAGSSGGQPDPKGAKAPAPGVDG